MKVLLVADSLAERFTSMNLYSGWVYRCLAPIDSENQYQLLQLPANLNSGQRRLKLTALYQRYVQIPRAIRSTDADIVHILDQSYSHLVPTKRGARVVVTCHDLIPLLNEFWGNRSRKSVAPGWYLYKHAIGRLSKADAVIVTTNWTRRLLVDVLDVPDERVWVVPYGVDDSFHQARWSPPSGILRLLHVGTNAPYKCIQLVVATVVLLAKSGYRVELVKAGPRLPAALATRVTGSGAGLIQLGEISNSSLPEIYSSATLLLFPSSREGFGLPVAEAMAVGLPVVASNIETLREVTGDLAEHVDSSEELLAASVKRLVGQPAVMERISTTGKEWAKQYQWSRYANSLNRIYEAVREPLVFDRAVGR